MTRLAGMLLASALMAAGQPAQLRPLVRFPIARDPLAIERAVQPTKPFTVAGEQGAILGEQGGGFEYWLFPVKVLSHFSITAELADYPVPIDVSAYAAGIEVAPAITTITYSHAAFTVRQRMFASRPGAEAGAVVLFEIASTRPLDLTFRFRPDMQRMWPAPGFGIPSAEWVEGAGGGYYVIHTDNPDFNATVVMPRARPGILAPYQERPRTYPVEFRLHFDPKQDSSLAFPLVAVLGNRKPFELAALVDSIPTLYSDTAAYYRHFFEERLTAETPDKQFDQALRWAEIAIDQARVRHGEETGLIAGYYESGDSARPGFAWFFGRDSLWTSYAVTSYGDFALTRDVLRFLVRRQRSDGKIMHEYSQTAELADWNATPYFYAAADATPLFVMAMEDYVNTSGDVPFLRANWEAVKHAYAFTRAHDSDHDGIYENAEGTGWVESWPPGMPHQEIYLAALDQQSADSLSRLAGIMADAHLAATARAKAGEIRDKLPKEYYEPGLDFYAFSRNPDGTLDHAASIYPAVAWWSGRLELPTADRMLDRWASAEFSTDWGTRDLSNRTTFYDPISYHQGSVWPLFTGWASLAEYRAGRTLAAYAHLMQNAGLTWAFDLGAVTELLSGEFMQALGRSSSHQTWSSAMVLTPALRGLFGLDWDATRHTLRLAPRLPATWDSARLRNVPLGGARLDLEFTRDGGRLRVHATVASPQVFCLASQAAPREDECRAAPALTHDLELPLPAVEIEMPHGLPRAGAQTGQLKAVHEHRSSNGYEVRFEGPPGSSWQLPVRWNATNVRVNGAEFAGNRLNIRFGEGTGYQSAQVSFTW